MAMSRLDEFYPKHFTKSLFWLVLTQTVIMGVASIVFACFATLTTLHVLVDMFFAAIVFLALEFSIGMLYLKMVLEPTQMLTSAIIHVSGEDTVIQPPQINEKRHEQSGLKDMIQTVYEINSRPLVIEKTPETDAEKAQLIVNALPVGIIALDAERNVIFRNNLAPIYTDPEGNQHVQLVFDDDNVNSLWSWLGESEQTAVSSDNIWTRVQNVVPGENNRKLFDVVAHYKKNAPSGIETIIITTDRTSAYINDETTMDFIALAAHELRGPITVIRGYLDVLAEELSPSLTGDQHELIDRLYVSSNRLSSYINNILNASRYDRRHLKLSLHEMTVSDLIDGVREDMTLRAHTLDRTISFDIPDDLPTVAADKSSVSEVLSNLIDNAIKYSRENGAIQVTAQDDGDYVEFSVIDHGIGIPSSVAGQLFSKFYRSHRSSNSVSGTGLGLYISRAIVESHGGTIGVRSTEGRGSTFSFTLPVYATVAEKLKLSDNKNDAIVKGSGSWIRNHSMYKG